MTLIDVQNLTIHKPIVSGTGVIVSQVSFAAQSGELIMIVGPSGAGKSSVLKVLNGLEPYTTGKILFKGQDIQQMDVISLRRQVGLVFQQGLLFAGTVEDNLRFGPRLQGITDAKVWQEPLDWVGLGHGYLKRDVTTLSGGEAQRVAIARTLANKPEVLLLDEPTSALDPAASTQIEELILELKSKLGLAVLWVSHDWEQVRNRADRVLLVADQRVREIRPSEVGERMTS